MCILNCIQQHIGNVIEKDRFLCKYVEESEFRYINVLFTPLSVDYNVFNKVINSIRFNFSAYIENVDTVIDGELFNIYLREEETIRGLKINKIMKNIL